GLPRRGRSRSALRPAVGGGPSLRHRPAAGDLPGGRRPHRREVHRRGQLGRSGGAAEDRRPPAARRRRRHLRHDGLLVTELAEIGLKISLAALLAGAVGAEREWTGKWAGLRTHMLIALGGTPLHPL